MSCNILKHELSKLNAIDALQKDGIINETRVLDLSRKDEFNAFHAAQIKATNKAYGLELESLYTISSNTLDRAPYEKVYNERVVPIDSAFEQVDAARKALGIYEEKLSYGEYRRIEKERAIERQEMESVKYQEVFQEDTTNEAQRVETFIAEMGQENTKNYPDGLFQEDGGKTPFEELEELENYDSSIDDVEEEYDSAIANNSPAGAASYVTPSFDKYLIHKKALLKKVNSTLQRLYEINKENHSVKTISRINELNKLKATIEKDIDSFNRGLDMFDLIRDFFEDDIVVIKNLLADPTLENLFLAEEMFNFITENIDQTRTGAMFHIESNQLNLPEVGELINSLTKDIIDLKVNINSKFDDLFLELLDKHSQRFDKFAEFKGMTAQDLRDALMTRLKDTSTIEANLISVDKEMWAKEDMLNQLIRLELELEQEKEKIIIQPLIEEINDTLKIGEKELSRLGMFFTVLGTKIYNYNVFKQKDIRGKISSKLVEKFSASWNNFLSNTHINHNRQMRTLTDPVAVITELNSFFDTMDHNVEWIDFSALHDVFEGSTKYDAYKNGDASAAAAYKADILAKIGASKYKSLIEEQKYNLDLFLQMKENTLSNLLKKERVQNFDDLSDRAKVNFQITMERNDPMSFITNRRNTGGNQVPVTFGTQTNSFPAYIKYNTYIPRSVYSNGSQSEFYDKDYEQIENNPILLRMLEAYTASVVATNNRVVGSKLDLDPLSLLHRRKNFREALIDKTWWEIAKYGLAQLLNVKQLIKNELSESQRFAEDSDRSVQLGGQIRSFDKMVISDYNITKTALKNILDVNLNDNSKINFLALSSEKRNGILELLGREDIDDIAPQGTFLVSDLKVVSQEKIMAEQTLDLPTTLKAHLEVASEHRARVNTKASVDVIKNRVAKNDEGGKANENRNKKRDAFVKKLVQNENVNEEFANISKALKGSKEGATDYVKFKGIVRKFFYKNLTPQERQIYEIATKRVDNIERQLLTTSNGTLIEKLLTEKSKLEGTVERLGRDYTGAAFVQAVVVKGGMIAGLFYNPVAPFKNFLNGMQSLMMRDGIEGFWTEGTAGKVIHHIILGRLKGRISKKHDEEWKKTVLFIESLRAIENQTTEIQKSENNSKLMQAGNLFTDGMYLTKKVEWTNQSVSLIARAMDILVQHPTRTNADGNPYTVPLFNGTEFQAHEIVEGKLKLKQEWSSPSNIENFEKFSSPDMINWKQGNKSILASLNGDYSQEGSIRFKQKVIGKPMSQYKTWLPNYLYDRFAYNQKSLSTGETHDGFYLGPLLKPKTSTAAMGIHGSKALLAILATSTYAGGMGLIIPVAIAGAALYKMTKDRGTGPLTSVNNQHWNQAKYIAQSLTLGTATTGINFLTSIAMQKNLIPIMKTNLQESATSEQDKKDFANLQLLTKSAQFNILLVIMSMAAMSLRGDDEEDENKGAEGSVQRERYLSQKAAEEEGSTMKALHNAVGNLLSNLYSELNFADDPTSMYKAIIQNNGVSSFADRLVKLSVDIASADDTIKSGDNAGESKLGNAARKQLPMIIRNYGQDDYNGGLESITRKEYDTDSKIDRWFNSDFKNDKEEAVRVRKEFLEDTREALRKEFPEATAEEVNSAAIRTLNDVANYPETLEELKLIIPERDDYDKEQKEIKN